MPAMTTARACSTAATKTGPEALALASIREYDEPARCKPGGFLHGPSRGAGRSDHQHPGADAHALIEVRDVVIGHPDAAR